MSYTDSVTHRRRMQISKNKRPDCRSLRPHCFGTHLLPAYNSQIDTMATEYRSHFIDEKNIDKVERQSGAHAARVTQHLELRIDEVFRGRGLDPRRFRLAVLRQHETSQQPPFIEKHFPNPARKIRERHCREAAV